MKGSEMSEQYIERYWRDATPQDAIKEPPMVARFRDKGELAWKIDKLNSWDRSDDPWVDENHWTYDFCQVYDAPDPGDGWRLVDEPQIGDEVLVDIGDPDDWKPHTKWEPISGNVGKQCIVRRRIEQPKPKPKYVPFTWEDREQLRGRWIGDSSGEQEYSIDDFLNDNGVLYICGHPAEYFLNWRFLDTGEPAGRRVE